MTGGDHPVADAHAGGNAPVDAPGRVERIAQAPLLIVGAPRSGTTWLQRLLLSDPRCCGSQESHFFVSFGRVLQDFEHKAAAERPHGLACYWTRAELVHEIRGLWVRMTSACIAERPGALLLVEKTPDHAVWIEVIAEILPHARFLHLVRDSRAVCASLLSASRQSWGAGWAPGNVSEAVANWITHVERAEQAGAILGPSHFLRVHYEDMIANPLMEARRIWRFLDLSCSDHTLTEIMARNTFEDQARTGGTPIPTSGDLEGSTPREPPGFFRHGSADSWRRDLGPLRKCRIWIRSRKLMKRLGYGWFGRR